MMFAGHGKALSMQCHIPAYAGRPGRTRVLVLDEADRMMTNLTLKKDMGMLVHACLIECGVMVIFLVTSVVS